MQKLMLLCTFLIVFSCDLFEAQPDTSEVVVDSIDLVTSSPVAYVEGMIKNNASKDANVIISVSFYNSDRNKVGGGYDNIDVDSGDIKYFSITDWDCKTSVVETYKYKLEITWL